VSNGGGGVRPLDDRVFAQLNAQQNVGKRTPVTYGKGGLSSSQIDRIEDALGFSTRPDFRVLLQNIVDPGGVLFSWSGFDIGRYRELIEWVVHGILFDVEEDWLWLTRWGDRPATAQDREQLVREDFKTWPKLLPICGHRFLPAEPSQSGNPVFSITQTDIIHYGNDLEIGRAHV